MLPALTRVTPRVGCAPSAQVPPLAGMGGHGHWANKENGDRAIEESIGGWASRHARQRVLKLSLPGSKRLWMDSIFCQIDAHPPPFDSSTALSGFNQKVIFPKIGSIS